MEITEMDIQEAYRALSLMHSSPHRRDDEFYRLAGEWLRLRNVNATDRKKYHAKLEKWHDDVIEYLVEMHLEAIERGLVRDPLAFLKKQKNPQGMLQKSQIIFDHREGAQSFSWKVPDDTRDMQPIQRF
jgi:hypothetical protein